MSFTSTKEEHIQMHKKFKCANSKKPVILNFNKTINSIKKKRSKISTFYVSSITQLKKLKSIKGLTIKEIIFCSNFNIPIEKGLIPDTVKYITKIDSKINDPTVLGLSNMYTVRLWRVDYYKDGVYYTYRVKESIERIIFKIYKEKRFNDKQIPTTLSNWFSC